MEAWRNKEGGPQVPDPMEHSRENGDVWLRVLAKRKRIGGENGGEGVGGENPEPELAKIKPKIFHFSFLFLLLVSCWHLFFNFY